MKGRSILAAVCLGLCLGPSMAARQAPPPDGISDLLSRLQQAIVAADPAPFLDSLDPANDRPAAEAFAGGLMRGGVSRAALAERDRGPLPGTAAGDGYRVLVEAFLERGDEARLSTIRLDFRRVAPAGAAAANSGAWLIADQEVVGSLPDLRRLSLNPQRQYDAAGLELTAEDLSLKMKRGAVFAADTPFGPTALVLVGDGEMVFRPDLPAERSQIRIFNGQETLTTPFTAAFVRVNPASLASHIASGQLVERAGAVDRRAFEQAAGIFRVDMPRSFVLELGELSGGSWSLMPAAADFLAEIHTRRLGALTYVRTENDAEDVNFFDRQRRKNIALYASRAVRERRGRFYDEDELAAFRVRHFDIDASFSPDRLVMQGTSRLSIEIGSRPQVALLVKLADSLAVRSVVSSQHGRLLSVRLRGQHTLVVSLPEPVEPGSTLDLTLSYRGRLEPQPIDREAITLDGQDQRSNQDPMLEVSEIPIESSYLFSNQSRWYPQASASGYATATLRLAVPPGYASAASGVLMSNSLGDGWTTADLDKAPRVSLFHATRPVRYLSWLVSRLVAVGDDTVQARPELAQALVKPAASPAGTPTLLMRAGVGQLAVTGAIENVRLSVTTNPRQQRQGRDMLRRAGDVLQYFGSIVGDFPYPATVCAVVEGKVPGGHSPAYLAVIGLQMPGSQLRWREDPASFPDFPDFFLAHELAHQWWGQAVGWKNYHEQWLSEGLAQYFAMLYAEHSAGPEVAARMLRQFQDWGVKQSDRGPIYLGYRVGHVEDDRRSFRAVVYNKSAAVLHMLRRLIGDQAFFGGLRRYYNEFRFRKAGTGDLRAAFEAETGASLERFFERWIHGAALPQVTFTWRSAGGVSGDAGDAEAILRFEQAGDLFDMPVTATLVYADGQTTDVMVPLHDRVTELRVPLAGRLARAEANRDRLAVAIIRQ